MQSALFLLGYFPLERMSMSFHQGLFKSAVSRISEGKRWQRAGRDRDFWYRGRTLKLRVLTPAAVPVHTAIWPIIFFVTLFEVVRPATTLTFHVSVIFRAWRARLFGKGLLPSVLPGKYPDYVQCGLVPVMFLQVFEAAQG